MKLFKFFAIAGLASAQSPCSLITATCDHTGFHVVLSDTCRTTDYSGITVNEVYASGWSQNSTLPGNKVCSWFFFKLLFSLRSAKWSSRCLPLHRGSQRLDSVPDGLHLPGVRHRLPEFDFHRPGLPQHHPGERVLLGHAHGRQDPLHVDLHWRPRRGSDEPNWRHHCRDWARDDRQSGQARELGRQHHFDEILQRRRIREWNVRFNQCRPFWPQRLHFDRAGQHLRGSWRPNDFLLGDWKRWFDIESIFHDLWEFLPDFGLGQCRRHEKWSFWNFPIRFPIVQIPRLDYDSPPLRGKRNFMLFLSNIKLRFTSATMTSQMSAPSRAQAPDDEDDRQIHSRMASQRFQTELWFKTMVFQVNKNILNMQKIC